MSKNTNKRILEALKSCGVSKKKEEKFHEKLDKLMHSTFGHSPSEKEKMKEDTIPKEYIDAISNSDDFRTAVNEKTLTPKELVKREEIAKAIERDNPGIDSSKKMAIATAQAKKVTEEGVNEGFADDVLAAAKKVNPNARMRPSNAELEKERIAASEKRKKELAKQPKKPVEVLKPKYPLGGYDPKSHRSYSEETEMTLEDFTLDELELFMESDEFDTLDEISKKTLSAYVNKAAHSMASSHGDAAKRLAKEETIVNEGMIRYADFIDKVYAHRKAGNDVIDHKYGQKKAHYTVVDKDGVGRTVTHTEAGSKIENHGVMKGYEKDEKAAKVEPVKRGRGRPKGSKSGART